MYIPDGKKSIQKEYFILFHLNTAIILTKDYKLVVPKHLKIIRLI